MPTRNINLTEHLDCFLEAGIRSGRYGSPSEVVREGLRLLKQRERQEQAKLAWLRGAVKEGLDQLDCGENVQFRSVDKLERHIDQLGEEATEGGRDRAGSSRLPRPDSPSTGKLPAN